MIRESQDLVAQSISDAVVAGWIGGANRVAVVLPPSVRDAFQNPPGEPPTVPPVGTAAAPFPEDEPGPQLPGITRAAKQLEERRILRPDEYYRLHASAKQQAFSVAGDLTERSIETIRDALHETMREGPSLKEFTARVEEGFDKLPISQSHLEQVYRNAVNESLAQGMEHVLDHPLVDVAFPYRLYVPIHDARARDEHLLLEKLGLDGTAVYWKDDPTWQRFRPPWAWSCRCGWVALSIKAAARMGVREAQQWLDTGEEPFHQLVQPPSFSPPPGWDRQRVTV